MQLSPSAPVLYVGETTAPPTLRFDMEIATAWRDAVRLILAKSFTAIVVDLDAPQVDGLAMLNELRSKTDDDLTFVWVTKARTNELALTATEAGVFQLLDKPASATELERAIVIAQSRLTRTERTTPLRESENPDLQALSREFDELVARMQTPKAKAGARRLFTATPEEFGAAALAAAKKQHG